MALSSASTGAMNAASVDGCLRLLYSHPQAVPVVAKPAVQGVNPAASSYTNLAATRSKSQDIIYSEGSSLSQLQIRPWPCNSGTRRPWRKPLAPVSAVAPNGACADRWADDPMAPAPLRVGIIGFGNFGQFIAKGILRQGHEVVATSRTDYSSYCTSHGIQFHRTMDAMFTDDQPLDVLLICSSILSTESLIRRIPFQLLSPDTVVTDVLSVKQFPKNLFLEVLPPETGILCTHPMFGPESGKHGWGKLPFVYDKVRVAGSGTRQEQNCERFLQIFEHEGCRMVEMSCEEHDRHAAGSQFITHTIGRILSHLDLESTPINTKGYETLLQLTENTVSDSFDLYYGLFMYNVNATEQMDNLDRAFETVKQKLFGRLHDILRKQLVERVPMTSNAPNGNSTTGIATSTSGSRPGAGSRSKATTTSHPSPFFLPSHDDMTGLSSFAIPSAAPAPAATSNAGRNNK